MTTALLLATLLGHANLLPGAVLAQTPASEAPAEPPTLEVSDPMLAPVAPAPRELGSWEEALGLLRQRSTDLRLSLAQVESAVGQRRVALAEFLPTLNGSAGVQYNVLGASIFTGGGAGGGVGGGFGGGGDFALTRPLGTGTLVAGLSLLDIRAIHSLRAADAARHAAELSLDETRRQLTRTLAQALSQVAASERVAEVNRDNLRSALERLAIAQRRLELGAGTKLDVIRLQQDSESARASVVSGDETLRQARDTLALVLGEDTPVGLRQGLSLDALLSQGQRQCRALHALAERPDQEAARTRLVAAERSVSSARAQYLPTLEAQSTIIALTVDPGLARVPVWNVGAVLTLPFYDGGMREGLVRQARAQEETARQNAVAVERSGTVEVRRTRRQVEVTRAQQTIATQARELAAENDRLTRRSFEVGTGTSQDLVVSAAALRQAELNQVVSEFQFFQARIESFLAEASCDW